MPVLIVEHDTERARRWQTSLQCQGLEVISVPGQREAVIVMQTRSVSLLVVNLDLTEGSALTVADFASYRHPNAKVIFLTDSNMFSDGSIFMHAGNACAYLPASTPPEDLVAMVEHFRSVA
ncbi:chemotaxis protein CheY [Defluviimonas sp. 20V17]|uniref:Response regulator n=1 Tax=Allgaiera indica TaxID=765699 RepID=A0AAN4UN53_9RHOB|nr:response regulator [Allgaiera indica]KDB02745.1 chemotaxis protein CheY [Defluviimonas sp. 20V17]GHD98711.1 response regulator [Allgaiera indica]SDW07859.1 Response regulator receiver domain-containing protein [Allgaiera indica]